MSFFRDFAAVMVRPRRTMRRILERPRDRAIVPLVVLAFCSASLENFNVDEFRQVLERPPIAQFGLVLAGILVATAVVMVALFFLLAWLALVIGRFFEGEGRPRDVRSAVAWGFVPVIWALVYRIPAAFLLPGGMSQVEIGERGNIFYSPGAFDAGCGYWLLNTTVQMAVTTWYLVVASLTLAEAHKTSGWAGFGTLVLSYATPIVVGILAVTVGVAVW